MKVLILFATEEGHTGRIARFVEEAAARLGHDALLVDADDPADLDFDWIDAVILAAPVHQRRHPKTFEALIVAHREELARVRTLLLSVSLSAAFPEGREEAEDYVLEMKMRTGLEPDVELLVAGAVRTDHYDYFAMQVIRHVVLRGRDFDPGDGEHDFTDWDGLSAEVSRFLAEETRAP
ncbi:flavodoxin domain-containing protein [Silicimonas sp. MF1-12-2]|uniref:flavodoxin domain-containing protein n=1 Tax=Silicimonas sp. MF1-12-2 TaxID=3384793 RepID=UPI0039B57DA4